MIVTNKAVFWGDQNTQKALTNIMNQPGDPRGYLYLTLMYLKNNKTESAQKSLQFSFQFIRESLNLSELFGDFINDSFVIGRFLDLLHNLSRAVFIDADVRGCRILIEDLDLFLGFALNNFWGRDQCMASEIVFMWGYFKNILGNYSGGKALLETLIQRGGASYEALSRTLAESLLGLWDLRINNSSGVDFSILQDYEKFSTTAHNSITPLIASPDNRGSQEWTNKATVFLSCDGIYFERLGIAQALSIVETSPGVGVHFHVMNPTSEVPQLLDRLRKVCPSLQVTSSLEKVDYGEPTSWTRKTFYASARFCRAASFIESLGQTVIITDADQIFRKDILSLIYPDENATYDVAIFNHQAHHPLISLYAKYGASFVVIRPTRLGRKYIKDVGFLIEHNLKRGTCWTLDQIALLAVGKAHQVNSIPTEIFELPFSEITGDWDVSSATVWNSAGSCKFEVNTYTNTIRLLLIKWGFEDIFNRYYQ